MVLLTCPECGGKVSDQATSCPHCGYPISKIEKPIEVRSDVFKYDDTTIVGTESYPYIAIPEGVKSDPKWWTSKKVGLLNKTLMSSCYYMIPYMRTIRLKNN